MAVHQRKGSQRLRPSSDADDSDDLGPTGPSSRTCFGAAASPRSSSTRATRKPTAVARTPLNRSSKASQTSSLFTPADDLLKSDPRKSISSLLLAYMQEQSPPPYTPSEFDHDNSYYTLSRQRQPTASSSHSIAGRSTTNIPSPAPPPLPYSSSSTSCCTNTCSHRHCHVRKRNGASSGSHPTSRFPSPAHSDSEAEDGAIYTSQRIRHRSQKENRVVHLHDREGEESSSGTSKRSPCLKNKRSLRHWLFALAAGVVGLADGRDDEREERVICTAPGEVCAGETETETDEPSRHLPTARIIPPSESSPLPASTLEQLQQKLIPLLFEFSHLLSIVPAFFGTIWNLYWLIWPPTGIDTVNESGGWGGRRTPPERADFFVAALWAILTGYQCLALTTGLLTRWQTYYPPLSTLIRLLALQGICWFATHLTLTVLDHVKRPVVCWCVVGTTTCFSRSVQIWVTSNISVDLSGEERTGRTNSYSDLTVNGHTQPGPETSAYTFTSILNSFAHRIHRPLTQRRPRFRWISTERRWDWTEVSLKCVLPAGILYFVMAWVGEFRREWTEC